MQDSEGEESKPRGGMLVAVITLVIALLSAVVLIWQWYDMYSRIEHSGAPLDLCRAYSVLTRSAGEFPCPYRR